MEDKSIRLLILYYNNIMLEYDKRVINNINLKNYINLNCIFQLYKCLNLYIL